MTKTPLLAAAVLATSLCAHAAHAQSIVRTQLDSAVVLMRREGFSPRGEASMGTLRAGADAKSTLRLESGTSYMIIGVCDASCSDMDLVLTREGGGEVESDREDDDTPMLAVQPDRSGSYVLSVSMATCSSSQCGYGVRVFESRGTGGTAVQPQRPQTGPARMGEIRIGQTVSGSLSSSDARLESDDTFYDLYRFTGRAGQRVEIVMRSTAFDAYMALGRMVDGELNVSESDDDAAGDNNPRIRATLPESGEYVIRANSLSEGETGAYTLSLRELPALPAPPAPAALRAGQTVRGTLSDTDPQAGDESHYDAYSYTGQVGERLTVTMTSDAFDTYLVIGRMNGTEFEQLESNDDGGDDGTNSQLVFTLPSAGRYVIRANSLSAGSTGAYTLTVASGR